MDRQLGIEVLRRADNPSVEIVFVHGIRGHAYRTWAARASKRASSKRLSQVLPWRRMPAAVTEPERLWPRDLLGVDLPTANILTYGYDAEVSVLLSRTSDQGIFSIARNLVVRLATHRELAETTSTPIVFVAHSLGGIVVKDALKFALDQAGSQEHLHSVFKHAYGVIFFGTPHRGSHTASLGKLAANVSGLGLAGSHQHLLAALEIGSPELERIADSFSRMLSRGSKGLMVFSFQEGLPLTGLKFVGKVVEDYSSIIGDAHEGKATVRANHMDMCRFSSSEDANYQLLVSTIRRWLRRDLNSPSPVGQRSLKPSTTTMSQSFSVADTLDDSTIHEAMQSSSDKIGEEVAPNSQKWASKKSRRYDFEKSDLFLVEQAPSRNFLGRDTELQAIYSAFQRQKLDSSHQKIFVLHGLGGVGKTQLALTYAYRRKKDYSAIFWIDGRNESVIFNHFRELAQRLIDWAGSCTQTDLNFTKIAYDLGFAQYVSPTTGQVFVPTGSEYDLVKAVLAFISKPEHSGWLLIFDAVDDLESVNLPKFLPKSSNGDILITSRRNQSSQLGIGFNLLCLQDGDATELLRQMQGSDDLQNKDDGFGILAKELGNLPLALAQAGSYIASTKTSIDEYLDLYRSQMKDVLRMKPPTAVWQYEETVFTTWEISHAVIRRQCQPAAMLLLLSSCLGAEIFPYVLLEYSKECRSHRALLWLEVFKKKRSKSVFSKLRKSQRFGLPSIHWLNDLQGLGLRQALNILLDFSLITEDASKTRFSMHSLVHHWCRLRDNPIRDKLQLDAAVLLGRSVDRDLTTSEAWRIIYQVLPYVQSAAANCVSLDLALVNCELERISLLHALERIADLLKWLNRLESALEVYHFTYYSAIKHVKSDNLICLSILDDVTNILCSLGQTQEAEKIQKEVIESATKSLGQSHSDTLTYLRGYGKILRKLARYDEASKILQSIVASRIKIYGPEAAVQDLIDLAETLVDLKDLDEALETIELAEKIDMKSKTWSLTETINILSWKAIIASEKHDDNQAEIWLLKSLELSQQIYGNGHPHTIGVYRNLMSLWSDSPGLGDLERLKKMEEVYTDLADACETIYGSETNHIQVLLRHIACLALNLGQYEKSLMYWEKVVSLAEQRFAKNSSYRGFSDFQNDVHLCAISLWSIGGLTQALYLVDRIISYSDILTPQQAQEINLPKIHATRAIVLRDLGNLDESEQIIEAVLNSDQATREPKEWNLIRNNLASVYAMQSRFVLALETYDLVLRQMREYGCPQRQILLTQHNLALLLERMGRSHEAMNLLEEVLQGKEDNLKICAPATLKTALTLGRLYRQHGRMSSAEELAQKIRPFIDRA